MNQANDRILTIGQVAKEIGVPTGRVRRLFQTGRLPEPERLGAYRIFRPSDLSSIRHALGQGQAR